MYQVTNPAGSKQQDNQKADVSDKQVRFAFLALAPLCMAMVLGWNGIGMLKPWPTRGVSVLYWSFATPILWLLTYAIFVFGRKMLAAPVTGWRFLTLNFFSVFVALNLYRPINTYFARAYARIFNLSVERIAPPWPRDFGNFADWQLAYLPFLAIWVLCVLIADRLSANSFLLGKEPVRTALQEPASSDPLRSYLSSIVDGALISVSAEDHYVRVHSVGDNVRFLYRFADALKVLGELDGQRIHRSHWVARDHICNLESTPGKSVLVLSDGRRLPVSASYRDGIVVAVAAVSSARSR